MTAQLDTPKISPRVQFIGASIFVVVVLAGVTLGLVLGLRTGPLPNGGSPTFPPAIGETTTTSKPVLPNFPESATGDFRYAAVQTDTSICSTIGTDITARHGGNAVDAAIASILCVGVVNAHSCGIGGGFFMTLLATPHGGSKHEVKTIISREAAPMNATEDMFVNNTKKSTSGGMASGVPGEVAGLRRAWELYGRAPWRELVMPTAKILQEGFKVEDSLASAIKIRESMIRENEELRKMFVKDDDTLLQLGDTYVDPTLAKTFTTIAEDPYSFYNGSLAQDIVDDIQDAGGIISLQDLANYTPRVRDPIRAHLPNANLTVYAPTAPASGLILQFALRLVDKLGLTPEDVKDIPGTILTYHRIAEIFKFAYAKRSALGDEDYVNVTDLKANLTSDEYISAIRTMINDSFTQDVSYYGPSFEFNDEGTAHMSTVAPDGSAVALTSTINLYFGSGVRGKRTGIMFNNEMDDFSTPGTTNSFGVPASPSNFIEPGKMPMSSMVPSIVLDGNNDIALVSGGSGGTKITSQTTFVAIQHLYLKKSLQEATDTARIHHQLVPHILSYERHLQKEIIDGLRAKGHEMDATDKLARIGSIADICDRVCTEVDCARRKCLQAVSDGRKGGSPDGF